MKKFFAFILSVTVVFSSVGCAPANGGSTNSNENSVSTSSTAITPSQKDDPGPADVIDTTTGIAYSLGMPKSVFDDAFGLYGSETEETERDGEKFYSTTYLNGCLVVMFHETLGALVMRSEVSNDRFSFYQFDFQTPESKLISLSMKEDTERYDSDELSQTTYTRMFDEDGKDCKKLEAKYKTVVAVARSGYYYEEYEDGDYISFAVYDLRIGMLYI